MTTLIQRFASDEVIDEAYRWLSKRRKETSPNHGVWHLRWRWALFKPQIQTELLAGTYWFSPLREVMTENGLIEVWEAQDALVLKAMAIVLGEALRPHFSEHCYHLAGCGGATAAVRAVNGQLAQMPQAHVMKSDVKGYYASIDHDVLYNQLCHYIGDRAVLRLLGRYMRRTVIRYEGNYEDVKRGISLGCPLSPLIGALYLERLDVSMKKTGLFYARFMDDWVIFAPTRWKLRKAVKEVNRILAALKVEKHPEKTFIGRAARGFDFLGYRFTPASIEIAPKTLVAFRDHVARLYEQGADTVRIGQYVVAWSRWARSGLGAIRVIPNVGEGSPTCQAHATTREDYCALPSFDTCLVTTISTSRTHGEITSRLSSRDKTAKNPGSPRAKKKARTDNRPGRFVDI